LAQSISFSEAEFMALDHLRRIVIEGPIAVGKTSLAQRLAPHLHAKLVLEQPEANPFLERYYRDPARFALPVQLAFLAQRREQMQQWQTASQQGERLVGDFLFQKDRLFADLTLPEDEAALYHAMADAAPVGSQDIDLVIGLQAKPADLLARLVQRGHAYESSVDLTYLERVCDAYGEFFHRYDAAPLLLVESTHFNPVEREADFQLLLERIAAMRGRREFLNFAAL
jgi:deoxyguanosine kinase